MPEHSSSAVGTYPLEIPGVMLCMFFRFGDHLGASTKSNAVAVPRAMGAVVASPKRLTQRGAHDQPQRTHLGPVRYLDDFRSVTRIVIIINSLCQNNLRAKKVGTFPPRLIM